MSAVRLAGYVLLGLAAMSLGAPLWTWILGIDPFEILPAGPYQPVSADHWLGTDGVGRDVLARLLYGARTSFGVAAAAAGLAAALGGGLGALAGFVGGWVDEVVVRAGEATMSVPKLPLLLLAAAIEVPGGPPGRLVFVVFLLVAMAWPAPARLARGTAMQCRGAGYVVAARALGATRAWIWRWHVWPRTAGVVAVGAAGDVAELVLLESLLSYLGFGIPEPSPSLGNLLSGGLTSLFEAPVSVAAPAVLTVLAVASLHVLADGLAVRIDPHRSSQEPSRPANVHLRDE